MHFLTNFSHLRSREPLAGSPPWLRGRVATAGPQMAAFQSPTARSFGKMSSLDASMTDARRLWWVRLVLNACAAREDASRARKVAREPESDNSGGACPNLRWTAYLRPLPHSVLSLRRIISDPKHYLR
jgi:hypothetical protein